MPNSVTTHKIMDTGVGGEQVYDILACNTFGGVVSENEYTIKRTFQDSEVTCKKCLRIIKFREENSVKIKKEYRYYGNRTVK